MKPEALDEHLNSQFSMSFSAYQVESLLDKFRQSLYALEKPASETLSISEDVLQNARQYTAHLAPDVPAETPVLGRISPQNILELIEDRTPTDPVVDYEQQRRAGRFVNPPYVPENPSPPFSQVTDYAQTSRKSKETSESSQPTDGTEIQAADSAEKEYLSVVSTPETLAAEAEISVVESASPELGFILEPEALEAEPIALSLDGESTDRDTISSPRTGDSASGESGTPISEKTEAAESEEVKSEESKEPAKIEVSAASLLDEIDDDDDDDDDLDEDGLRGEVTDEADVVFGSGKINPKAISQFVDKYPDSTVKFLLRRNLDGRPLPAEYDEIYTQWEERGLLRGRLKKYLLKLMEWREVPDLPIHEVVQKIRERQFELREQQHES